MKLRRLLALAAAALLANAAQAATVLVGDGIEWSWSSADVGQSSGSLTLHADVSGSTLGGFGDVRLAAFSLKEDASFVIASAEVLGGGWTWSGRELSANGCSGGEHDFNFCFDANDIASSVTDDADFDLVVNFVLASGVLPEQLHLKVDWNHNGCHTSKGVTTCGWHKVGTLISDEFSHTEVPLPGTLGLLGVGLAALGAVQRRKA